MSLQSIEASLTILVTPFRNKSRKDISDRSLADLEKNITNALHHALYDPSSKIKPQSIFKKWALCSHPDQKRRSRKSPVKVGNDNVIPILSSDLISEIDRIFSVSGEIQTESSFFNFLKNAYDTLPQNEENIQAPNISIVEQIVFDLIHAGLYPYEYMASCRPLIFYQFPRTNTCYVGEPRFLLLYFIQLRVYEAIQNSEYQDDTKNTFIAEFNNSQLSRILKKVLGKAIFPPSWLNATQAPLIDKLSLGDGMIKYHILKLKHEVNKNQDHGYREYELYISLWRAICADPMHLGNFSGNNTTIEKYADREYQYQQYNTLKALFSNEPSASVLKRLGFTQVQVRAFSSMITGLNQAISWIYRHAPDPAIPKPGGNEGTYAAAYCSKQSDKLWNKISRHPQTIGINRFPQWLAHCIFGLPILSFVGSALFWLLHYEIYNVVPSNLFVTYVVELGLGTLFGFILIHFVNGLVQAGLDTLAHFSETDHVPKLSFLPEGLRSYYLKIIFPFLNILRCPIEETASYKRLLQIFYPARVLLSGILATLATAGFLVESLATNIFTYLVLTYFAIPNLWFDGPGYFKAIRELPGKAFGVIKNAFDKNVKAEYAKEQDKKTDLTNDIVAEKPKFLNQYLLDDVPEQFPKQQNVEHTNKKQCRLI